MKCKFQMMPLIFLTALSGLSCATSSETPSSPEPIPPKIFKVTIKEKLTIGETLLTRPPKTEIQRFNYGDKGRKVIDAANTCAVETKATRFQLNSILDILEDGHIDGTTAPGEGELIEVDPADHPEMEDVSDETLPETPEAEPAKGFRLRNLFGFSKG